MEVLYSNRIGCKLCGGKAKVEKVEKVTDTDTDKVEKTVDISEAERETEAVEEKEPEIP